MIVNNPNVQKSGTVVIEFFNGYKYEIYMNKRGFPRRKIKLTYMETKFCRKEDIGTFLYVVAYEFWNGFVQTIKPDCKDIYKKVSE